MRLKLKFGNFDGTDESIVVEWNEKNPRDFPVISTYKGKYWSFTFFTDGFLDVDYELILGETKKSAIPVDQYGNSFPVANLEEMFDLKPKETAPCTCGAKFTDFPDSHMANVCERFKRQ